MWHKNKFMPLKDRKSVAFSHIVFHHSQKNIFLFLSIQNPLNPSIIPHQQYISPKSGLSIHQLPKDWGAKTHGALPLLWMGSSHFHQNQKQRSRIGTWEGDLIGGTRESIPADLTKGWLYIYR
jgi:hypothetical protein